MRLHVVAILDTMWGAEPGDAPRFFKINPDNHSGRRLYSLIGDNASLLVTDSCREIVTNASHHGKPDPAWLCENLQHIARLRRIDVLLVCGKVAKQTYAASGYASVIAPETRVIEMPHPAARSGWTKEYICAIRAEIAGDSHSPHSSPMSHLEVRSET